MSVAILTDSAADLSPDMLRDLNVYMEPLSVTLHGKEYFDQVDITVQEFLDLMQTYPDELPMTAQPSPASFLKTFNQIAQDGYRDVIYISLCADWSGTNEAAHLAAKAAPDNLTIHIVDSLTGAFAQGLLVMRACALRDAGYPAEKIVADIEHVRTDAKLIFVPGSLENLVKGGRASKLAGLSAGLLNIRPIISVNEKGELNAVKKSRGNKVVSSVADMVETYCQGHPNPWAMFIHTNDKGELQQLRSELTRRGVELNVLGETLCGAIISTHGSAGSFGITLCPSPEITTE